MATFNFKTFSFDNFQFRLFSSKIFEWVPRTRRRTTTYQLYRFCDQKDVFHLKSVVQKNLDSRKVLVTPKIGWTGAWIINWYFAIPLLVIRFKFMNYSPVEFADWNLYVRICTTLLRLDHIIHLNQWFNFPDFYNNYCWRFPPTNTMDKKLMIISVMLAMFVLLEPTETKAAPSPFSWRSQ